MRDLLIVLRAELQRKLRSRVFWLATIGGIAVVAFLIEAPFFFAKIARTSTSDLILAGPSALVDRAVPALEHHKDFHVVARVARLPARVTVAYLEAHGHAGAAVALAERNGRMTVDIYPRDISAFDQVEFRNLEPRAIAIALHLPPASVTAAATLRKAVHPLDARFKYPQTAALAHGVAFGLIFLLYLAIILGSQSVMAAIAEEKTSRIAEILIATIRPSTLLYGKTIAAALIAFVQVALWLLTAAALLPHAENAFMTSTTDTTGTKPHTLLATVEPGLVAAFLGFFILGYLQYAAIYAAAASLVSRTEDLGVVTTPVIMPVVGAFFVAQYALVEPNAPVVVACSFIPFLSPFVAFTRLSITSMPAWHVGLIFAINVATVALSFWAAGKIYRVGMLLYGKTPSLPQVVRALRA